jgi:DNA end-binding protein Ku
MASKSRKDDGGGGARSIASASISFGLVSIPVRIVSTSEPSHEVHFHMIHAGCGERVKQEYHCPKHGKVERSEIAKGYQPHKGATIELAQAELDALDAVASDEISLVEFVPASAVDPIYVERTYYLGPAKGGDRAYRLLHDALDSAGLAGIAQYAARGNAYIVMLRPFQGGLAMHQLRYADEIKPFESIDLPAMPKPKAAELELAHSIVQQLAKDAFDATAFHDEVKERVEKLLEKKVKSGEAIVAPEEAPAQHIPDLMAALRASLAAPAKRTTHAAAKHAPAKRTPRAARRHRTAAHHRTRRIARRRSA